MELTKENITVTSLRVGQPRFDYQQREECSFYHSVQNGFGAYPAPYAMPGQIGRSAKLTTQVWNTWICTSTALHRVALS
jgi:hypothetical protein